MKVFYIAGAGRSGSTLLEMILGNVPGCFSVGEVRHFWEYLLREDILCGCGEHLKTCSFWGAVSQRLKRFPGLDLAHLAQLSLRLNRTHNLPKYNRKLISQPDFKELLTATEQLYALIQTESGASWIIDSSKAPTHLFILNQIKGIDLRVLHLIRDPRAVVYSWNRRVKHEPGRSTDNQFMEKRPIIPSTLRWLAENYYASKFGTLSGKYFALRYEDFVHQPKTNLQESLSALKITDIGLEDVFLSGKHLQATHSVGGNPIRFNTQTLSVSAEETWKKEMGLIQRLGIGLISLPMIAKFGYRLV